MHEDRCGVRLTVKTDNAGELKYSQKGPVRRIPQGGAGPDISPALEEMRARMKGCGSTLWMIVGEGAALWGPAFNIGRDVTNAAEIPGARRYIMLL